MPFAICELTIAPGECYQHNSLAGKPCLPTCIAGDGREYGKAFVKLSELLKSNRTEQRFGTATTQNLCPAKLKQLPLEQVSILSKHLIVN